MKKTKIEKGITLIALIITIVVLLILAVVAINSIQNDGILVKAQNSTDKYNQAVTNEQTELGAYEDYLSYMQIKLETATKVEEAQKSGNPYKEDIEIEDDYGNKVKIPAGFKIASDSATSVESGIVIEDVSANGPLSKTKGSQFVWVPVGKINTSKGEKTITFDRYEFNTSTGVATQKGESEIKVGNFSYKETTNISEFKSSVTINGGYYIGRYEAGDASSTVFRTAITEGTLVCKANQIPYDYISQNNASLKSKAMYSEKTYTSDLVNSYAWDTAIVFIQNCGTEENANIYSIQNNGKDGLKKTGEYKDEYCKINDMSGNYIEWSTETQLNMADSMGMGLSEFCTRGGIPTHTPSAGTTVAGARGSTLRLEMGLCNKISFRPIIYF